MTAWISQVFPDSPFFMPHGHCYLWIPSLLWLHVSSDILIGTAYIGIAGVLWALVRRLRLPFSPVFLAFGLFIALCGGTHFMEVWTAWDPHYWLAGWLKAATALASVATAVALVVVRPKVHLFTEAARVSEERRIRLESTHAELAMLYDRLKRADEYKSDFFASLSHELRTPLALIVGPASRLKQADNLTEPQRRALQGIQDNATVLLRQVNDLLDLTKSEARKMVATYAEVELVGWTRRVIAQFDGAFEQHRLSCTIDTPPSLVAAVDADKLERVLINLLGNAVKFTPAGGAIAVQLRADAGHAVWSVADSGPGIPPAHRAAIFERFHRGGVEGRSAVGGTGLGLAIAKDFIELHKGRVTVGDATLGGAEFVVEVPIAPPDGTVLALEPSGVDANVAMAGTLQALKVRDDGADAAAVHPPGTPEVVVVEDNAEMRAFVRDVLATRFRVTTAVDGVDGLATVRTLRPDLVVSDLTMPGMDGEALLRAIRAVDALDHVPVLLLTARSDDALRVRLLQSGAQDYVVKPYLPDELLARAENLVSAKRAGDTLRTTLSSLSGNLESLAHDISVRNRQLSAALAATEVAREQAERASLVKSSFLGLISHEIRTPLAAILMNLELLGRDPNHALAPATGKKIERVASAARQLQLLMEGLLEYVRFDRGSIEPLMDDVDVATVVHEVVEERRDTLTDGTTMLDVGTSGVTPCRLWTDRRLLSVLLGNLVGNAVKFTREGTIEIVTKEIDGNCVIEVKDTGIGIPSEALGRIFLPFEQLEPLQRKSLSGVGLGLALVKQIIESLHGTIEVHSTVGAGSTFRVRLPLVTR